MLDSIEAPPLILSMPELVTAPVLDGILRKTGAIKNAHVTGVAFHAIGVGLLGDTMRFEITYDRPEEGAPASIAGKFPARDAAVRASGAEIGVYMTETRFYQEIAEHIPTRVPGCLYAEIDPATSDFGLLLEDIGPARAADQLAGCTREDAELAMIQAAKLHAPRFGDATLWDVEWMKIRKTVQNLVCGNFARYMDIFHQRYDGIFAPEYMRIADAFAAKVAAFATTMPERFSLIHADYRLDNMLFDAKGGKVPLVILDWQSVAPDNPGQDVSYFIGTSYPMALRSRDERELVRFYHEEMQRYGVRDYAFDDLWQDYRRGAWLGLFTAIFASAVAKRTERGDQMFMRMGGGAAAQMLEHDTLGLA